MGVNLGGGACVVNGTTCTAATALRTNTTTRGQIANGNVGTFINFLNTSTIGSPRGANEVGSLLRRNGFAKNYIVPSPQYSSANIAGNHLNTKYQALQLQFDRRLTSGITNTTTWTWSKSMSAGPTIDPQRRQIEQALQSTDRTHQWTSHGTYELPFGTGGAGRPDHPGESSAGRARNTRLYHAQRARESSV
jgi:hypothetical protein